MDSKEFKKVFCAMAKQYGFKTAYGCCYKESAECLFVLELQRSYYSKLYYLNMKTYIQGAFGREYAFCKKWDQILVKRKKNREKENKMGFTTKKLENQGNDRRRNQTKWQ